MYDYVYTLHVYECMHYVYIQPVVLNTEMIHGQVLRHATLRIEVHWSVSLQRCVVISHLHHLLSSIFMPRRPSLPDDILWRCPVGRDSAHPSDIITAITLKLRTTSAATVAGLRT